MQRKQVSGSTILHIEMSQGMDHEVVLDYVDPSTLLPVDLTGWKADLHVKSSYDHPQILKGLSSTLSQPDGDITLNSQGQIKVHFSGDFSLQIPWSDAVYDLVLTPPNLRRRKIVRGKLNIYNTVTFPDQYNPVGVGQSLVLTIGVTELPSFEYLYGYFNPLRMGLATGLLLTGDLRPSLYEGMEIVELSHTGGKLRLVFRGNIPDNYFSVLKIGSVPVDFANSSGRTFNESGAGGVGLTYWEWENTSNPFGHREGTSAIIQFVLVAPIVVDPGVF